MPKYVVNKTPNVSDEILVSENPQFDDNLRNVTKNEKLQRSRVLIVTVAVVLSVIMFLLCIWLVHSVFFNNVPQWQQDNYIIESVPGLRYRPKPPDIYSQGSIIAYDYRGPKKWIDIIDNFLEAYRNPDHGANTVFCDYDNLPGEKSCYVDPKEWGPCSPERQYGYSINSPCVFLKLNTVGLHNFVPEYYNDTRSLPADMPTYLKEYISFLRDPLKLNTVWVTCQGENAEDIEFIGPVEYFPILGFPGYFFPFRSNLSPLVAVLFERPTVGILINIECRLWAHNIDYNKEKGTGFVHFELMID